MGRVPRSVHETLRKTQATPSTQSTTCPKNCGAKSPAVLKCRPCRTWRTSSLPLLHHFAEVAKEIMRIVRPRRGLGMILHAEQWQHFMPQSLERLIVQVDVRQFHLVCIDRIRIDGEVVVMRCNLHLARGIVLHWMIAAVVPKLELLGFSAQRQPAELMSKADAENWHTSQHVADRFHGVIHRFRIARAIEIGRASCR